VTGQVAEARLAARLAADLHGAFEALMHAYQDRLFAFALGLAASRSDAEEIVQDAFVRAYRALARYPVAQVRELALGAWLYRITLNVSRNRARTRRLETLPLNGRGDLEAGGGARPEAVWERTQTRRSIATQLAALPDRYRAAVVLRHVDGLRYQEVAAALGQPVGTVKSNVHRGTRLLRESLGENIREVV
jgi:RNA polymerase sigma-70 factor (ECF subfamily)